MRIVIPDAEVFREKGKPAVEELFKTDTLHYESSRFSENTSLKTLLTFQIRISLLSVST
jgi:hypothetical protein